MKHSLQQVKTPTLVTFTARVVMAIAVGLSLYQLYTAGVVALTALVQRSIHLGAILTLVFLTRPVFAGVKKNRLSVL